MKNPVIRTIYLYLFALIGLGMLVVGASMLVNLGLKAWVFTQADIQDNYISRPVPFSVDKDFEMVKELDVCGDKCELSETEKEQIAMWLADYTEWKNIEENRDPNAYIIRNRARQASTAVSLILIGLPLWLFHWFIIKRDLKNKKED